MSTWSLKWEVFCPTVYEEYQLVVMKEEGKRSNDDDNYNLKKEKEERLDVTKCHNNTYIHVNIAVFTVSPHTHKTQSAIIPFSRQQTLHVTN